MEFRIEDYYKSVENERLIQMLDTYRYNINLMEANENTMDTMGLDSVKLAKAIANLRYYADMVVAEMVSRGMEVPPHG